MRPWPIAWLLRCKSTGLRYQPTLLMGHLHAHVVRLTSPVLSTLCSAGGMAALAQLCGTASRSSHGGQLVCTLGVACRGLDLLPRLISDFQCILVFECYARRKHGGAGRQVLSALEEQGRKKRKAASLASLFHERKAASAKQRPRSTGTEASCLTQPVGDSAAARADGADNLFAFNFTALSN